MDKGVQRGEYMQDVCAFAQSPVTMGPVHIDVMVNR